MNFDIEGPLQNLLFSWKVVVPPDLNKREYTPQNEELRKLKMHSIKLLQGVRLKRENVYRQPGGSCREKPGKTNLKRVYHAGNNG